METINEKAVADIPGTRMAENILVRLKNEDGSVQEVPLLMILADFINRVVALEMKMSVLEPAVLKKDNKIIAV